MDTFSTNGYIEKNVEKMQSQLIEEDDNQFVLVVVGRTGSSKTSLSLLIDHYLNNGDVDLDNYCLNHEDFMKAYTTKPKGKTIVYEEGRDSFDRNKHSHTENKEARDALRQYRKFHHTVIINFQDASDLQPELVNKIAHGMIRTPSKGIAHFYGRQDMKSMWGTKYFKGWQDPTFRDYFPNPENYIPEINEQYEQKAEEQLEQQGENEFENIDLITPKEAADIVGVSAETVRNRCDDGTLDYRTLKGSNERRIVKSSIDNMIAD